ncbi:RNA pol Rpb4 domain containing protein [Trichuris trichiura]|uniref:DNA-directed RNA polymerase III subunit RPC9 n=1 Tax=Trichuris trichiura TaxID=36087 RepID=A0A077Z162_TRITR|nr:RNA pol Rpb4 domain containing protein [Trichuris trichiura]
MSTYPKFKFTADLCNWEVYRYVREEEEKIMQSGDEVSGSFPTILYELRKYLEEFGSSEQTEEGLSDTLEKLAKYNLTKLEALQLINNQPKVPVVVYRIIDNCEERYTEEQVNEILELCRPRKKS